VTAAATNYQVFYATPLPSGGIPHTGAGNISDRMTGWTAGGGLEWKLDARWSVKAEYLYYDLGSVDFSYVSAHILPNRAPFVTTGLTSSVRFDGHIVRAGLNFAL
jgi:outer membrane immunogenic protein